ncbi:hypothetical protein B0H13DRAFT_2663430 [Mycena leptocephala]|nr:hypothetical protein B0H13DRAFT_2663430 [Mycena leptocephala]
MWNDGPLNWKPINTATASLHLSTRPTPPSGPRLAQDSYARVVVFPRLASLIHVPLPLHLLYASALLGAILLHAPLRACPAAAAPVSVPVAPSSPSYIAVVVPSPTSTVRHLPDSDTISVGGSHPKRGTAVSAFLDRRLELDSRAGCGKFTSSSRPFPARASGHYHPASPPASILRPLPALPSLQDRQTPLRIPAHDARVVDTGSGGSLRTDRGWRWLVYSTIASHLCASTSPSTGSCTPPVSLSPPPRRIVLARYRSLVVLKYIHPFGNASPPSLFDASLTVTNQFIMTGIAVYIDIDIVAPTLRPRASSAAAHTVVRAPSLRVDVESIAHALAMRRGIFHILGRRWVRLFFVFCVLCFHPLSARPRPLPVRYTCAFPPPTYIPRPFPSRRSVL